MKPKILLSGKSLPKGAGKGSWGAGRGGCGLGTCHIGGSVGRGQSAPAGPWWGTCTVLSALTSPAGRGHLRSPLGAFWVASPHPQTSNLGMWILEGSPGGKEEGSNL